MSTRKTLEGDCLIERCIGRDSTLASIHVKAELDKLARLVRKLYRTQGQFCGDNTCVRLKDVLDLIKQQKR